MKRAVQLPGPGEYEASSMIGQQRESRRASEPMHNFTRATREQESKVILTNPGKESPGPQAYAHSTTSLGTQRESVKRSNPMWCVRRAALRGTGGDPPPRACARSCWRPCCASRWRMWSFSCAWSMRRAALTHSPVHTSALTRAGLTPAPAPWPPPAEPPLQALWHGRPLQCPRLAIAS